MRRATGADPRSALHTACTSEVNYTCVGIARRGCGRHCPRKTGPYGRLTRMHSRRRPTSTPTLTPGGIRAQGRDPLETAVSSARGTGWRGSHSLSRRAAVAVSGKSELQLAESGTGGSAAAWIPANCNVSSRLNVRPYRRAIEVSDSRRQCVLSGSCRQPPPAGGRDGGGRRVVHRGGTPANARTAPQRYPRRHHARPRKRL